MLDFPNNNFANLQKVGQGVVVVVDELLDTDADHPAADGAHAEGGDEDAGRNFDSESEDRDHQLEDQRQRQLPHGRVNLESK